MSDRNAAKSSRAVPTFGLRTAICDLFGIEYPIIGAPMGGVAGPALVAAVSNAGGIGLLGHASVGLDEMRHQIRETAGLTDKPFGVGLLFPSSVGAESEAANGARDLPDFLEKFRDPVGQVQTSAPSRPYDPETTELKLDVAIDEGVQVLSCGLGAPSHIIEKAKGNGMHVIALVGNRRAAVDIYRKGADVIVAQGHEAGGHTGRTATMVLVPQVVDAVEVPVVAAGGIGDGRSMAAALVLGAQGVLIGTRLLATHEAKTADAHKQKIVDMMIDETVVSRCYTGKPSRIIRNAFVAAWQGHEHEILPMPQQWDRVASVVVPAKERGSLDIANWPTGQGAVLVPEIKPAAEVVRSMAAEAVAALDRVAGPILRAGR